MFRACTILGKSGSVFFRGESFRKGTEALEGARRRVGRMKDEAARMGWQDAGKRAVKNDDHWRGAEIGG